MGEGRHGTGVHTDLGDLCSVQEQRESLHFLLDKQEKKNMSGRFGLIDLLEIPSCLGFCLSM